MSAMLTRATIEDLYNEESKAELINGEIVRFMATGRGLSRASGNTYMSLRIHEQQHGGGITTPDNAVFIVDLPNRESFSPDVVWYVGEETNDENEMNFFEGAPLFAVEVRSKNDYGKQAEKDIADKRRDYFAARTLVVWDVDLLSDDVVKVYRASDPETPIVYSRSEVAEAEPAVPDWRFAVNELFR